MATGAREKGPQRDPTETEIEWQFDALDLRPVERWLASLPARTFGWWQALLDDTPPEPIEAAMGGGTVGGEVAESSANGIGPAPDRSDGEALTALAQQGRRLSDRYFDTADWRVARAGFVVRTRRHGRHDEVTLKDLTSSSSSGLRTRLEVTEALPPGGIGQLGDEGPVGRRLRAVAGQRSLVEMLEVRTRRRPFSLRFGDVEVAEVALDETSITAGTGASADGRPVRLRRVEVEVAAPWAERLGAVVEDLAASSGLRPATLSKFEAGLLGLGISLPANPDFGPDETSATSTVTEVAYAALRRHLGALVGHEPGTRLGEDPEELHDMRVATRRLRAALGLFEDVLPEEAQAARAELRWLGQALGSVRDLDVQLERHDLEVRRLAGVLDDDAEAALGPLFELLDTERHEARRVLLQALESQRYESLLGTLSALVTEGSGRGGLAQRPATSFLPDLVEKRHRQAAKAAKVARRSGRPDDFHQLRIRCKRLRYCLEFTSGVYGEVAQRYTRRLARLQDALGALQDAETQRRKLHSLSEDHRAELPVATVYAMGALAGLHHAEVAGILARSERLLKALGGRRWRGLRDEMEDRRERGGREALGSPAPPPAWPAHDEGTGEAEADGVSDPSGQPDEAPASNAGGGSADP